MISLISIIEKGNSEKPAIFIKNIKYIFFNNLTWVLAKNNRRR